MNHTRITTLLLILPFIALSFVAFGQSAHGQLYDEGGLYSEGALYDELTIQSSQLESQREIVSDIVDTALSIAAGLLDQITAAQGRAPTPEYMQSLRSDYNALQTVATALRDAYSSLRDQEERIRERREQLEPRIDPGPIDGETPDEPTEAPEPQEVTPQVEISTDLAGSEFAAGSDLALSWIFDNFTAEEITVYLSNSETDQNYILGTHESHITNAVYNLPSVANTSSRFRVSLCAVNRTEGVRTCSDESSAFTILASDNEESESSLNNASLIGVSTLEKITETHGGLGYFVTWEVQGVDTVDISYVDAETGEFVMQAVADYNADASPSTKLDTPHYNVIASRDLAPGEYRFEVSGGGVSDVSHVFTHEPDELTPEINVTSPDSGASLVKGNTHTISWTATGVSMFDVELHQGGSPYKLLADDTAQTSMEWAPSIHETSGDYEIVVKSFDGSVEDSVPVTLTSSTSFEDGTTDATAALVHSLQNLLSDIESALRSMQ